MKQLTWVPQRQPGGVFCSSACGGSCLRSAYERAARRSKRLAQRLGRGWTTRVWENLGWHWEVVSPCGRWKVHGDSSRYTAFLGKAHEGGGYWVDSGKTPGDAMRKCWEAAKIDIAFWKSFEDASPVSVLSGKKARR